MRGGFATILVFDSRKGILYISAHMYMTTVKARSAFSTLINRAAFGRERMILTRRGKAIVAVVPIEDVERLEALEDQQDLDDARQALKTAKRSKSVPWSKLRPVAK